MTTQIVHYNDGSHDILVSKAPPTKPESVDVPKGWLVVAGDGQRPARYLHDYSFETRSTNLAETGEWFPTFGYDGEKVINPKHIVNLQGTFWLDWMLEVLGPFNFSQKANEGDGTEDTNTDDENNQPLLDDGTINPYKERKQMNCVTGGAVLNVTKNHYNNGRLFYFIESLDFYNQPQNVNGVWLYDGKPLTWENAPHLFTSRVNRKTVKAENKTWISVRGIQAVSDGGLTGAKLMEWWPNCSKYQVCLPANEREAPDNEFIQQIKFFPELPTQVELHAESVIVDGELVQQTGGISFTIDAYMFYGSDVYVKEQGTNNWYLADEMLVRTSLLTGWYAKATDYRCYITLPGETEPWMGERGYGVPNPGIWRKDVRVE